ncbi:MAG: hypothetical protein ACP5KN_17810 [Armatimonadota bacterium]
MRSGRVDPVDEYLPRGEVRGCVLVVSDYRMLNLGHAATVRKAGYAVYTAVTCTDVPRIFEAFTVGHIDLVVFASLVHGWHHQEAEERPQGIPRVTDDRWQTRNIAQVIETVSARQRTPPKVLVATDLIVHDCYDISADGLAAAGIKYQTYSASDPTSIVGFL